MQYQPRHAPTSLRFTRPHYWRVTQVVLVGQHTQNLDLDVLDVSWLVNFAVKILEVFFVLVLAVHVLYHILDVL
jgi:hypothetical protein